MGIRGLSIAVIFLVVWAGCEAVPSRHHSSSHHHGRGGGGFSDGGFVNFPSGFGLDGGAGGFGGGFGHGGSVKLLSHSAAAVGHSIGGGYGSSDDGFDPRLPDPPCLWTAWSACSSECDGGVAYRFRRINDECSYGPDSQVRSCNTHPCPQDCVFAEWAAWNGGCSECSVPCGGGIRSRTRAVTTPALFGGVCNGRTVETEGCNEQACPVDCVASGLWTTWGACSAACGGGTRTRSRQIDFITVVRRGPSQTEAECPSSLEEEPCNTAECAIDCLVSPDWTQWTPCSETCGNGGQQTRSREIVVFPQNGGAQCPLTMETRTCAEGGVELPACDFIPPRKLPFRHHKSPSSPPFTRNIISKPFIPTSSRQFPVNPIIRSSQVFQPQPRSVVQSSFPNAAQPQLPPVDPNFCVSRPDGPYAHPQCRCCNDLIMCFQRQLTIKWCPSQLVYSELFKKCVTRSQARC